MQCHIKPSRILAGMVFLFLAAQCAVAVWAFLRWGGLSLPFSLTWLGLGAWQAWRSWRQQQRYQRLQWRATGQTARDKAWEIQLWATVDHAAQAPQAHNPGQPSVEGQLCGAARIGPWIIFLQWRTFSGRRESIALACDACAAQEWRALQIWLHHSVQFQP